MSRLEISCRGILLVGIYPLLTLFAGVLCRESSLTMGWAGIALVGKPTPRSAGWLVGEECLPRGPIVKETVE